MSSSASQAQEAHQPAAAEASHKRNCEESKDDAGERAVVRKYGLDPDLLDCPICMTPFSQRVYQCNNGHTICWVCCTKLDNWMEDNWKCPSCTLPTGNIRCIAIEKLIQSLSVSCKYARHGCEEMQRPSFMEYHERYCKYKPFRCPVPECDYEASRDFLQRHLTKRHKIKTAGACAFNIDTEVTFRMGPSNIVLVIEGDIEEENPVMYLIHRKAHENLGDIYFCTHFRDFDIVKYNLRVTRRSPDSVPHSMENARAIILQDMESEYLQKEDFLVVPPKDCGPRESFEVHFKVTDCRDFDD